MREAVSSRKAATPGRSRQGNRARAATGEPLKLPTTRESLARLGLAWLLTIGVGVSATLAGALVGH